MSARLSHAQGSRLAERRLIEPSEILNSFQESLRALPRQPSFCASTSGGAPARKNGTCSCLSLSNRPIAPCRAVGGALLTTDTVSTFQIQGSCGVPVGAKAAFVRLQVARPTSSGDLTVYPSNLPRHAAPAPQCRRGS